MVVFIVHPYREQTTTRWWKLLRETQKQLADARTNIKRFEKADLVLAHKQHFQGIAQHGRLFQQKKDEAGKSWRKWINANKDSLKHVTGFSSKGSIERCIRIHQFSNQIKKYFCQGDSDVAWAEYLPNIAYLEKLISKHENENGVWKFDWKKNNNLKVTIKQYQRKLKKDSRAAAKKADEAEEQNEEGKEDEKEQEKNKEKENEIEKQNEKGNGQKRRRDNIDEGEQKAECEGPPTKKRRIDQTTETKAKQQH